MKVQGKYEFYGPVFLSAVFSRLEKELSAFEDRVLLQLDYVCKAATLFPEYNSRLYTVRQFVTDHPETRYVPGWKVAEKVNFTCEGLAMTDVNDPHRHAPVFVDADGTFHVPERPLPESNTLDAGCVQIQARGDSLFIEGDIPESELTPKNEFWKIVQDVLQDVTWWAQPECGGYLTLEDGSVPDALNVGAEDFGGAPGLPESQPATQAEPVALESNPEPVMAGGLSFD